MNDVSSIQKTDAGWAIVETNYAGRFPGSGKTLEFSFDEAEKCRVKFADGETENEFFVERRTAEDFLKTIIYLGRKPEVRSESGWTRRICVTAKWRNLAFAAESEGEISETSYEWTIEEMEEYLPTIKDAKTAAEVKATMAKDLHRRAIEIHLETEKFVKRLCRNKTSENVL